MTTFTSPARRRPDGPMLRSIGALLMAVAIAGTACGWIADHQDPAAPPTTNPTTAPAPAETSTSAGPAGSTTTVGPSTEGGYPSAITDEVIDNPDFERLTREIDRRVSASGVPGSSILILQDGELVEQEAFGSYQLSTQVPIASASKWLSGVVIMTLVDEGKIDLDAPIRTYLPETTGPAAAITTRQLLSFTSGLPFDDRIPCTSDPAVTLAECNREILQLRLLDEPGAGYRYTSTHLHVAAGVAEAVTGMTWNELVTERLTGPLHMDHTTFDRGVGPAPDHHPMPAGGAVSTLGDYGRFLEMLVHKGIAPDGTRILSEAAIAEMSTNQIADAKFVSASGPRKAAETPYGLAHWLDRIDADGHAVVESSPGAFGFRPWIDHANSIAGVHLVVDRDSESNTGEGDASGGFVIDLAAAAVDGHVPQR